MCRVLEEGCDDVRQGGGGGGEGGRYLKRDNLQIFDLQRVGSTEVLVVFLVLWMGPGYSHQMTYLKVNRKIHTGRSKKVVAVWCP